MTDIVGSLVKRPAELAGEAAALRAQVARIVVDLGHLDAVIRQFKPEQDRDGKPAKASAPDGCGASGRDEPLHAGGAARRQGAAVDDRDRAAVHGGSGDKRG